MLFAKKNPLDHAIPITLARYSKYCNTPALVTWKWKRRKKRKKKKGGQWFNAAFRVVMSAFTLGGWSRNVSELIERSRNHENLRYVSRPPTGSRRGHGCKLIAISHPKKFQFVEWVYFSLTILPKCVILDLILSSSQICIAFYNNEKKKKKKRKRYFHISLPKYFKILDTWIWGDRDIPWEYEKNAVLEFHETVENFWYSRALSTHSSPLNSFRQPTMNVGWLAE